MKNLLFIQPLKPSKFSAYKKFIEEKAGSRRQEYKDLLQRYGLKTAKIWHHKLHGIDYIFVLHEADNEALELLKDWPTSTHPFDLWFKEQLNQFFASTLEQAHLLLEFDARY